MPPVVSGKPPNVRIDESCFASHATQFRIWLKQRDVNLFDLPRDDAKRRFVEFVAAYNAGTVDPVLYGDEKQVQAAADDAGPRTGYTWGFAKSLEADDRHTLDSLRDAVATDSLTKGKAIPVHIVSRR